MPEIVVELVGNCKCGRPNVPHHCKFCGSTNRRAMKSKTILQVNTGTKEQKVAPGYSCYRCGMSYNILDECNAPPPKLRRAEQLLRDLALEQEEKDSLREKTITRHKPFYKDLEQGNSGCTFWELKYFERAWNLYNALKGTQPELTQSQLAGLVDVEMENWIPQQEEKRMQADSAELASRHPNVHTPDGGGQ